MKEILHILATVHNPALTEAALLVFKTLRLGFPQATVQVWGNGLETFALQEVERAAHRAGATFANFNRTSHDRWIEELVLAGSAPFWICDTDVVFFGPVEHWFSDGSRDTADTEFAGRFEPEFDEEWTRSVHVERLHTCLMWFNAPLVRRSMRGWMGRFPALFNSAQMNLVRQQFIPRAGQPTLFYDTCAGLWHAGAGQPFADGQNDAFEHLHCATYSDQICVPGLKDLARVHKAIFANPAMARGLQREQAKYYSSRRPPGTTLVVPEKGTAYAVQSSD